MNKWMADGMGASAGRERAREFKAASDLGLRRRAAPRETSRLIKRAVSHLRAKQSGDGVADGKRFTAPFRWN